MQLYLCLCQEPVKEESPLQASKPDRAATCLTPLYLSSEPSISQQHRGKHTRQKHEDQDKVKTDTGVMLLKSLSF